MFLFLGRAVTGERHKLLLETNGVEKFSKYETFKVSIKPSLISPKIQTLLHIIYHLPPTNRSFAPICGIYQYLQDMHAELKRLRYF